ncbi:MAG: CBS domain-containing protein [Chloroflexaceae bacterium]|nr:CBS domain-containing protein [Chloroflexaceae bacterium]
MNQSRTVLEAKRYGVHSCTHRATLSQVAEAMVNREISTMIVVDDEGYLSGIITRTDVLRAYLAHDDWASQPVQAYMSNEVVTVDPQTLLHDVARMLLEHHIRRVVVAQPEGTRLRPLAVFSAGDLLYHIRQEATG